MKTKTATHTPDNQNCQKCNEPDQYCGCKRINHTPGPLSFDGMGVNGGDEYASRIATFTKKFPDMPDANHYGPLFAAAPEMLNVIKRLKDYLEMSIQWDRYYVSSGESNTFYAEVDRLIAKAEGRD